MSATAGKRWLYHCDCRTYKHVFCYCRHRMGHRRERAKIPKALSTSRPPESSCAALCGVKTCLRMFFSEIGDSVSIAFCAGVATVRGPKRSLLKCYCIVKGQRLMLLPHDKHIRDDSKVSYYTRSTRVHIVYRYVRTPSMPCVLFPCFLW